MSESKLTLPAHTCVEQLRKQAKELLKGVRAGDAPSQGRFAAVLGRQKAGPQAAKAPTLSDAQLVLAREYGFESWPALVNHVSEKNPAGLGKYQRLAESVAAAYMTGDVEAIRKVNWLYGTSFVWDRDPVKMQVLLSTWFKSKEQTSEMALEDAKFQVARMLGAESWAELVKSVASVGAGKGSAEPVFYRFDARKNVIETRGPLGESEWDVVLGLIREGGIAGLRATGKISDSVLEKFPRLRCLRHVWFDGVQVSDEGLCKLGRMGDLETLDLSGPKSQMTDKGLEMLGDLKKLKKFSMCWPQKVTDAGTVNLEGCHELEEVNLMGTHTGDATLKALMGKAKLKHLTTGRKVTDAGVPLLHGIPAFKTWQGGDGDDAVGLMSFMAGSTQLLLDGPITDEGLAGLAGLDGLFGLGFFWHAKAFTSRGLEPVAHMANLGFFSCDGTKVDDAAMGVITRIPKLRMLQAQGAVAGDDGFEALSKSQTLEHLWGRECPNLGGRGFAAMAKMPRLTGLAVSCKGMDDVSLATLPRFPALKQLMPMDVGDEGFAHVGKCVNLEKLWCMYCRDSTDVATQHIAGFKKLNHYYAGRTLITDRSLEILAGMETLETIELWQTLGVTTAGVAALARLPRLKKLSMSGLTGVSREVLKAFGAGVEVEI